MKFKVLTVFTFVLFSLQMNANDMSEFFADVENERKFLLNKQKGMLTKIKEQSLAFCESERSKKQDLAHEDKKIVDCQCFSEQLNKLSDREIYFESVSSYLIFQKMVAAKRTDDVKEYQRLKREKESTESLSNRLEKVCSK